MKNKKLVICLIVSLSIITVFISIFFVLLLNGKIYNVSILKNINYHIIEEQIFDEEYLENFEKININAKASEIEIKKSDDAITKLNIYGNKELFKVDKVNNNLDINIDTKTCHIFCINLKISKVVLYLPSDYEGDINIDSKFGDITIDEFKNMDLGIRIDTGDIKTNSMKSSNIISHYGDIEVLGNSNNIEITADAGDIFINSAHIIKVSNHYGDIKIGSIDEKLNITADAGDIEIDKLNLVKDSNIHNNLGDIRIGMTNELYIDAKTSLGDTKIKNNYLNSNIKLNITNSCGDIIIHN